MNEHQSLIERRKIASAMLLAAENASVVLGVCAATAGGVGAVSAAIAAALGIGESEARIVLDMQVRRFTSQALTDMRSEIAELDQRIRLYESAGPS